MLSHCYLGKNIGVDGWHEQGRTDLQEPSLSDRDCSSCGLAFYFRFNLSLRDVEEMLERGITVSYETIRR